MMFSFTYSIYIKYTKRTWKLFRRARCKTHLHGTGSLCRSAPDRSSVKVGTGYTHWGLVPFCSYYRGNTCTLVPFRVPCGTTFTFIISYMTTWKHRKYFINRNSVFFNFSLLYLFNEPCEFEFVSDRIFLCLIFKTIK